MNILVIDDDSARQSWFGTQFQLFKTKHNVSRAFNDLQALELLKSHKFDLVFFDHDLGIGMNGQQIASEILWNEDDYMIPKSVWIHSENPVGVKHIKSIFNSYNPRISVIVGSFSSLLQGCASQDDWFEMNVEHMLNEK
jgi:CheY-like chemotaxis protein